MEALMEVTVNKIIPHEELPMEVHVRFRDAAAAPHPYADVVVFVEKYDHPLSEMRSIAIRKALDFLSQITSAAASGRRGKKGGKKRGGGK
jgi:hypothetical protein